tara:strand:+ start:230 stop:514 length:285 start_codon:yes stop_codon:yes gene_type:complete
MLEDLEVAEPQDLPLIQTMQEKQVINIVHNHQLIQDLLQVKEIVVVMDMLQVMILVVAAVAALAVQDLVREHLVVGMVALDFKHQQYSEIPIHQ